MYRFGHLMRFNSFLTWPDCSTNSRTFIYLFMHFRFSSMFSHEMWKKRSKSKLNAKLVQCFNVEPVSVE